VAGVEQIRSSTPHGPHGHMPARNYGDARTIFEQMDRDHSGKLDNAEFIDLCHHMGVTSLTDAELEEEFSKIDESGDGGIHFGEFQVWWKEYWSIQGPIGIQITGSKKPPLHVYAKLIEQTLEIYRGEKVAAAEKMMTIYARKGFELVESEVRESSLRIELGESVVQLGIPGEDQNQLTDRGGNAGKRYTLSFEPPRAPQAMHADEYRDHWHRALRQVATADSVLGGDSYELMFHGGSASKKLSKRSRTLSNDSNDSNTSQDRMTFDVEDTIDHTSEWHQLCLAHKRSVRSGLIGSQDWERGGNSFVELALQLRSPTSSSCKLRVTILRAAGLQTMDGTTGIFVELALGKQIKELP
jgi:hypothetical protein